MQKRFYMAALLACFYFILIGAMDDWKLRVENQTLHKNNTNLRKECNNITAESNLLKGIVYKKVKLAPTMNNILQEKGNSFIAPMLYSKQSRILKATAYTPRIEECDSDPFIAASGDSVRPYTIAVSRDLMQQGWKFGRCVFIQEVNKRGSTVEGGICGFYFINDVMHSRWKSSIDIIHWNVKDAFRFGCRQVKVYLL